jgi:hypothetical protein
MQTHEMTAAEVVHRLLFRALLEMRSQGHEQKNQVVFHLADLFHNIVLEMESAAEGQRTYEDVYRCLEEKAKEKGLERWLTTNREALSQ